MGPRVFLLSQEIPKTAAAPFDGTPEEAQAHFDAVNEMFGLALLWVAGILAWIWALFPCFASDLWVRIFRPTLVWHWSKRRQHSAFVLGLAIATISESRGNGLARSGALGIGTYLVAFPMIMRKFNYPPATLGKFVFAMFFIAFVFPHHARATQKIAQLNAARVADSDEKRSKLLEEAGFPEINEREISEEVKRQQATAALWFVFIWICVVIFAYLSFHSAPSAQTLGRDRDAELPENDK